MSTFGVAEKVSFDNTENQEFRPSEEAIPAVDEKDGLESWSSSSTFGSTFVTTAPANSII